MIWLQTFAFLVLACLTQAQDDCSTFPGTRNNEEAFPFTDNSFPYYHISNQAQNADLYTSSIVSYSSGPLCSGFHLSEDMVATAASCVLRHVAKDLVVITHSLESKPGPLLHFLSVNHVAAHPKYNFKTGEYDFAVILVNNSVPVPTLMIPMLGANTVDSSGNNLFMAKYSFNEKFNEFSSLTLPADANLNLKNCTSETYGINSFICVSQTNQQPYSYGLLDLGTPLITRNPSGDFFSGMFTGHVYNKPRYSYLYLNVYSILEFINNYVKHKSSMRSAFNYAALYGAYY